MVSIRMCFGVNGGRRGLSLKNKFVHAQKWGTLKNIHEYQELVKNDL